MYLLVKIIFRVLCCRAFPSFPLKTHLNPESLSKQPAESMLAVNFSVFCAYDLGKVRHENYLGQEVVLFGSVAKKHCRKMSRSPVMMFGVVTRKHGW